VKNSRQFTAENVLKIISPYLTASYERIGLIPEVPRTPSGIRSYDEMSLHWIEFAMRFKKGGFP